MHELAYRHSPACAHVEYIWWIIEVLQSKHMSVH
jgi:hypothetical protein